MAELVDTVEQVTAPGENGHPPPTPPPGPDEWKTSKNGKEYTSRGDGRQGVIYRQGEETIEQARARYLEEQKGEKRPKRKSKTPKMPEGPRKVDLKQLEATLAEALKSPALICATFGDEWASSHFTTAGPYLARNLILASEHNPWLRTKLEEAATGQDAAMMVISMISVGGAAFMYIIPPVIWWFNLPAPAKTREMFGIPERKGRKPDYAADQTVEFPETTDYAADHPAETPAPAPYIVGA